MRYAILGMLSIEPMSGYEIRQTMQQSTENFWAESDGDFIRHWQLCRSKDLFLVKPKKLPACGTKKFIALLPKA